MRLVRERRVGRLDPQLDGRAQELQAPVLLQRAREQAGLGEDLEAVADADDGPAGVGEVAHGVHDRREPGDGAGAQVVAVGEAAGHDDGVDAVDRAVAVPEDAGLAARGGGSPRWRRARSSTPGTARRRPVALTPGATDDRAVLDHRVGQEAGDDVVDLGPGRGLVVGLDLEADALAHRHAADAVEPERRQRPLDGGALRVGDALLVTDLDLDREAHRLRVCRLRTRPLGEPPAGDALVGVDVAGARGADDVGGG